MSDLALGLGLVVILGGGAAAIGYLVFEELERRPSTSAPPFPPEAEERTVTVTRTIREAAPRTTAAPQKAQPDMTLPIAQVAASLAAPLARPAAAGVLNVAGDAIKTGTINLAAPSYTNEVAAGGFTGALGDAFASPSREAFGNVFQSAGADVLGLSKIVTDAAIKLVGLRGASEKQQRAIFSQTTVEAAQGAVSAIPFLGPAFAAGVGALAGTYEGRRLVKAVGVAEEQVYVAQKEILSGHVSEAFSGGGSSHKSRVMKLLQDAEETKKIQAQALAANTAQSRATLLAQDAQLKKDLEAIKVASGGKTLAEIDTGEGTRRISEAAQKAFARYQKGETIDAAVAAESGSLVAGDVRNATLGLVTAAQAQADQSRRQSSGFLDPSSPARSFAAFQASAPAPSVPPIVARIAPPPPPPPAPTWPWQTSSWQTSAWSSGSHSSFGMA